MRAALDIAAKDLRQKVRDRSALFLAVLAPLGLAFLFSTMIPNQDTFHATYAVVDLDGGPVAAGLTAGPLQRLTDAGIATIVAVADEADARERVRQGSVDAAIVIPAGFSEAVLAGTPAQLLLVGGPATLSTGIARSILARYGSDVTAVQVAVGAAVAARGTQPDPSTLSRLAAAAIALPTPISVTEGRTADRQASTTTYYGASMAVLFVFFAAQFGVVGLLAERRTGTLARMLASPVGPRAILLGKVLVSYVLAVVSMSIIVLATTFLLRASWGDPAAVLALVLATALAATGIATLVVGFARTEDQAGSLVAIVAITLGIIGGSFFPISQAPEGMATLSMITPHRWFIVGINDLAAGGGVTAVAGSLAVLCAIGAATLAVGLVRARRVVVP